MIVQRHSNQPYVIPDENLPDSDLLTIHHVLFFSLFLLYTTISYYLLLNNK